MTTCTMGWSFVFDEFGVQSAACFTFNQRKAQAMNAEIKTIALTLAVLAVIYRIDGVRRLLTNSF